MRSARLLFAIGLGIVGCSSSSGSSLNTSEAVIDLSSSDQKSLCDWWASQYGGYGGMVSCGGGLIPSLRGPTDQPSCLGGLPQKSTSSGCTVTVGNYEGCVKWRVANGCSSAMLPPDCNATHSSLCVPADAGTD